MTRCAEARARVGQSFHQLLEVHKLRAQQVGQTLVLDPQAQKAQSEMLRGMENVAVRESLLAIMDGIGAILDEINVKAPSNGKRQPSLSAEPTSVT